MFAAGHTPRIHLTACAKWDAKAHGPKRFNHFETTEDGKPGLRVWRVA